MKTTTNPPLLRMAAHGLSLAVLLIWSAAAVAQSVAISESQVAPDPSAMLDVQSLTKGMLIPRMTEGQRLAIASPANGLIVYQTINTANSLRGFWYYDATQALWTHLGRGEYTGVIQQPNTVVSSSQAPLLFPVEPGVTNVVYAILGLSSTPSVMVGPEFSVVGTPPAMDEYCLPEELACSNFGRLHYIRVYHPEEMFATGITNDYPPLTAHLFHPSCLGSANGEPNAVNRKYLPFDGGEFDGTTNFNNSIIDMAGGSMNLGFAIQGGTANNKSFSFWIDLNQDGDFTDAGELIATYNQIPMTTNPNRWYFGSGHLVMHPPVTIPASIANGLTKMRIMARDNFPPMLDPCYPGDGSTKIYDMDLQIVNSSGGAPFFPNDLNWCNVSGVTPISAEISCYDKNGTLTDMRFHYKIIPHD